MLFSKLKNRYQVNMGLQYGLLYEFWQLSVKCLALPILPNIDVKSLSNGASTPGNSDLGKPCLQVIHCLAKKRCQLS